VRPNSRLGFVCGEIKRGSFIMTRSLKLLSICGAAIFASASWAVADGYEYDGKAMEAPKPHRELSYSFNIAGTTDYIFRGISQTDRDPTLQGGADFAYGSLYLGIWASGLDFGEDGSGQGVADLEIDIYGGYTPSWDTKSHFGKIDFDFGVIYYLYPGARDDGAELDYVELKAGYSWSPLHPNLTTGTTVYWSPEYSGELGTVWTVETSASYEFHSIRGIVPTFSGLLGWQTGDSAAYRAFVNGDDEYYYWNAGLELAIEKITLDFRYWDTDIANNGPFGTGFCDGPLFQCDETFVFTVKVEVP